MKIPLKPIKPKRVSDQVFDQLRELIFRGEFKPGEQITPERELADAMNVSRTSIRDAISKLAVTGLLEQRQGQGTFVRKPDNAEFLRLSICRHQGKPGPSVSRPC